MILKRVAKRLRAPWPQTPRGIRGDRHFAHPELMPWALEDPPLDFILGLANPTVLKRLAAPTLQAARERHETRPKNAARAGGNPPPKTGLYTELDSAAGSWPQPFRVILKAEVTAHADNPRFVVTALEVPTPEEGSRDLDDARGQDEHFIKRLKNDLHSDRTSDSTFLANHLRLFYCAADVLLQTLRAETLTHTELAHAQLGRLILKRFKRAVPFKDRIQLHRPTSCPVKGLFKRVTERLHPVPAPLWDTS
jgi:hypothetical protein